MKKTGVFSRVRELECNSTVKSVHQCKSFPVGFTHKCHSNHCNSSHKWHRGIWLLSSSPAVGPTLTKHHWFHYSPPLPLQQVYITGSCQQISSLNCNLFGEASPQLLNDMSFMVLPLTATSTDKTPLLGGQCSATPPSAHITIQDAEQVLHLLDTGFFTYMTNIFKILQEKADEPWASVN